MKKNLLSYLKKDCISVYELKVGICILEGKKSIKEIREETGIGERGIYKALANLKGLPHGASPLPHQAVPLPHEAVNPAPGGSIPASPGSPLITLKSNIQREEKKKEGGSSLYPTIEHCKQVFTQMGSTEEEAKIFHTKYSNQNWKISGMPIGSWVDLAVSWIRKAKEKNPVGNGGNGNGKRKEIWQVEKERQIVQAWKDERGRIMKENTGRLLNPNYTRELKRVRELQSLMDEHGIEYQNKI